MNYSLKLNILAVLFLAAGITCVQAQAIPVELQTPEIVSLNRMPMRANAFAYESKELAQKKVKENSAYFMSLNGTWKFNWVQDPTQRPKDFYKTNYNDASWVNFKVPANWETNGYGLPIYVNHPYEFTGRAKMGSRLNPPFDIPEHNNPVGSYRRKITIPENWDGRQVFIHLGAVKSAFFIWVNGEKVGYSEDSKMAAEFDITKYVKKGENLIALEVYRWSDGSYLECQDMWRISGIERDVYLYATPKIDIRDFTVLSGLDQNYKNGLLDVKVDVNSYIIDKNTLHSRPSAFTVALSLADATGNVIWKDESAAKTVMGNYKTDLSFKKELTAVKQWSAEIPYLYTLYITLKDAKGEVLQVIPQRVGFRSVEIKGSDFLVNGKRVFIKGVNRHEHNATQGHTLTRDDMRKDMEMMKKLNINAVRHSHYTPDPYWMELCDEYGLYVVDEANIESHGRGYDLEYTFANDKVWRNPHFERITRMYQRDKNHPSVVTWSLGNEAGNGVNMYEGYQWLKNIDASRPVQYERAEEDFNTDMIVPQYPDPNWLIYYSKGKETRPLIMSEFAHIMGNSLGNYKEYWDNIEKYPKLQGGFIWEWIDQGIDTVRNGKRFLAYGGDFPLSGPVDQNITDNNFSVKGVVTAYRKLTPMAVEVKKVHQFIKTAYTGQHQIKVNNSYFFRDINNTQLTWEVLENGKVIEKGLVANLAVAPRDSITLSLPIKTKQAANKEYYLNVRYTLKQAEPFLEKGYEVANEQFDLAKTNVALTPAFVKGIITLNESADAYTLSGNNFNIVFDTKAGTLKSYTFNKTQLLQNGPEPSFWRAPTDNDMGAGYNGSLRNWRNAYQQGTLTVAAAIKNEDGSFHITFKKDLVNGDAAQEQVFTIYADGTIKVDNRFTAIKGKYPLLLRMGTNIELNEDLGQIEYYGRGPWENYWDRKTASLVGIYKQTVNDQYFGYARPQESGNKTEVRWVNFTNKKGNGLQFVYEKDLLSFAALPYSLDDLDPERDKKQYHSGELDQRNKVYVHMDLQQSGMQGIDSWGSQPLKEYRIPYANHQYSYWIKPIK